MLKTRENDVVGQWKVSGGHRECCVLLLEDVERDSDRLEGLLSSSELGKRYRICTCRDRAQALASLDEESFDVLLLDLGLSDRIDLRSLAEIQERARCPILVLSGSDDEEIAVVAMQHGAQDFLNKHQLTGLILERTIRHSIERYRLMAELATEKRKAVAASQAKSDFLAVMSHEFRTPMNGILGGINLLRNFTSEPQALDLLNMMRQCAESQLTLIGDVLDISKIEAGSIELAFERFSPRDLIASVLSAVSFDAREKGIKLAVDIDRNLPRELVSDARRVRQVLMNLVGNAVKFTMQGEVRIHARLLNEQIVEFRVSDTGIGIARSNIDSIFETFTQVDSSYSRRYQGTGLGLAICKRLVKLLGGTIRVESELGRGSEFRFTIACGDVDHLAPADDSDAFMDPDVSFAQSCPLSILVVEDNELVRSFLSATFSKLGYHPMEANSGSRALAIVERQGFDVIFMDIRMPNLDGFDTAEMLMEKYELAGRQPPYIAAITATVTKEIEQRCSEIGIPALLAKPIELEDICATLKAAFAAR